MCLKTKSDKQNGAGKSSFEVNIFTFFLSNILIRHLSEVEITLRQQFVGLESQQSMKIKTFSLLFVCNVAINNKPGFNELSAKFERQNSIHVTFFKKKYFVVHSRADTKSICSYFPRPIYQTSNIGPIGGITYVLFGLILSSQVQMKVFFPGLLRTS